MITLASAKLALGLPAAADPALDPRLQQVIDDVTALVGRELGRYLGPERDQVEVRRGGAAVLALHEDPVPGQEVTVRTRTGPVDAWQDAVAGEDYVQEGRALRHGTVWPAFVEASYTRGYGVGTGPAELQALVREVVALKWSARTLNAAVESESIGDYSYTRRDLEAVDAWPSVARRWRRLSV